MSTNTQALREAQEKIVYDILCSDENPPNGRHWEVFLAERIVAALSHPPAPEAEKPETVHRYVLELPEGDKQSARMVWSERKVKDGEIHHHLCVLLSDATPEAAKPEPQAQAGEPEWICPSCKVNRLKAPCLTPCGNCPMKGEAR